MKYDEARFIDLEGGRGVGPARKAWGGGRGDRARAVQGHPPAIFKITSHSKSAGAVWGRFEYISREDELEMEGPNGELYSLEELEQKLEEWQADAGREKGARRLAMSAFVTFPKGVDEEKATAAARQFFAGAFGENHDYVFAPHRDTENFHVHVVVQAAGLDGKQIRIGRDDIQDLRIRFAEAAADQGIELDASPRWARGEDKARRAPAVVEGMLRRWKQPELELAGGGFESETRRTQLEALVAVRRARDPEADVSPLEYARGAALLAARAGTLESNAEKVQTMKCAIQLARFGFQQSQGGECSAAEEAAVRQVVGQVDKDIAGHIRARRADQAAQRELWAARRPLGEHLAAARPEPARKWAREEEQAKVGPWDKCQALEYAKTAGEAAMQLGEMKNDRDKLAAIEGAVVLARFGQELVKKDQGSEEQRAHAREIIDKTERTMRSAIQTIEDPQVQKKAIQARQRLYKGGVEEYRREKGEERRRERAAAQTRDRGEEREL